MDKTKRSAEEHTNIAFVGDDGSIATTSNDKKASLNGVSTKTETVRDNGQICQPLRRPKILPQRPNTTAFFTSTRKSSIAEVVMTMKPSLSTSDLSDRERIIVQLRRQQYKYVHPFGKTTTLVEDLLCTEDDDDDEKTVTSSMAKLVVWLVFCCFMVGVAGAIILGAESFSRKGEVSHLNRSQSTQSPDMN